MFYSVSIEVSLFTNLVELIVNITIIKCILSHLEFFIISNYQSRENDLKSYFYFLEKFNLYKKDTESLAVDLKTINTISSKINNQFQSLAQTKGGNCKCQRDNEANKEHTTEVINVWLKFYNSLLDQCMYASLKLAELTAGLRADLIVNFRTANPVMVGSRKNNKEQCHRLWQCQTIVDS